MVWVSHMTKHLCLLSLPKSGYILRSSLFPFFINSGGRVLNTCLAGLEFLGIHFGKPCCEVVRKQQTNEQVPRDVLYSRLWMTQSQVCEDRGASQSP